MIEITYKAIPFPLHEMEQQTLRRISEKVRKHYADRVNKAVGPKNAEAYSQSLRELEEYVEWLREHYGIEVTRPRIRPNN
jgi:uncharacterized protein YeeX (DUF496 family)